MEVVVIGAGIGGLSAALRLRALGYAVHVIEALPEPGGKLRSATFGGYRFDLGPSLFTMPWLVDELFSLFSKTPHDYFRYQKLDPICHYFFEDGTRFRSRASASDFEKELTPLNIPEGLIPRYLSAAARIHRITTPLFLNKSLHRLSSYLSWNTLISMIQLPFIQSHETMHAMNRRFFKDQRLVQYFDRFATYNGSDPYQAPGTLNLISHLEHSEGAYFPSGGMISITQGLFQLACETGIRFTFNTRVERICTENEKISGVETDKGLEKASIVISNMDVYHTYKKLLPQLKAPRHVLTQQKSSSALIFYWGIKKEFNELGLHNIFFSKDYEKEFSTIWNDKAIADDPTIYINITSKYTKKDAPPNSENWFVMINVPSNDGQDWEQLRKKARASIIKKINRLLNTSIESFIETEEYLDPLRIEERTGSYKGALYGNASNNATAAFFRQSNASGQCKGLYFVGGSVHPGGGVPLANLSGKIAADLIAKDFRIKKK